MSESYKSQHVRSKDGTALIRRYLYLPVALWSEIDIAAAAEEMTTSVLIEATLKHRIAEIIYDSNSTQN